MAGVSEPAVTYPSHWEADAVLADGGTVHLRPIRPDDADGLRAFHSRLSPETVYNRFFTMVRSLSARDVERFTTVDYDDRVAVVAVLHGDIVGVCRYDRHPGTTQAEVAVVVEDAHQGRGLGPLLLEHLAAAARERGVDRFVADVLPSNRRMLSVFRSAGFEVDRELADGYVELTYPIGLTEASLEVMREREHRAEARSVARLLAPKAVAVVGASRQRGSAGHEVFRSLLAHGFEGPVYPVNPVAPHVASVRAYADVRDVPDDVDLAVVAVPAPQVADVVRACSDKNVRGLVVVSGGFGDAGDEGRARLEEVVRLARDGGMRLLGPNAMGVVNTDPAVRLHATFAAGSPPPGRVGVFSQSGALAGTVLAEAARRSLGISTFVSIGDRADVSGNDLLQYWEDDERTDVVVMHLRGFGNPRKFARIARRVGRRKPVVALKSGRGAGDAAVEALFASAGVVRADTLDQLYELAQLLAVQPLPTGRRVGVVGTSSALAALAVDACRAAGLTVPALPDAVREQLRALAGTTETANPVDLGPLAAAQEFGVALRLVAESGEVDALLALVTPHPDESGLAVGLLDVSRRSAIPVIASYLGHNGVCAQLSVAHPGEAAGRGSVPSWSSPEAAAVALARAADHAAWRTREAGVVPVLDRIDPAAARRAVADSPLDAAWLPGDVASAVLRAVGLQVWPSRRVSTLEDALAAARDVGWPVGLKSADPRWRNRTDVGAVRLGLDGEAAVVEAWKAIEPFVVPGEAIVQPMAPGGVSTVVRLVDDRAVGPLVSLRLGGVAADLLADPVTRTAPLTDAEAEEIVHAIRGAALLRGTDTDALADVLLRLARLSEDVPEVAEVLLDPVLVGERGVTVLHAGVRLLPPGVDPEVGPRRLVDLRPSRRPAAW
jgi:acyl-CoA synthetase (NDP forming)/GNAT superfamily N-acetyltransferase